MRSKHRGSMKVRVRMCGGCPIRGGRLLEPGEGPVLAALEPEQFPCHEEDGYTGGSGIQCRGHWGLRRKYWHGPVDRRPRAAALTAHGTEESKSRESMP